jgi:hypothetical protein
MTHRLDSDIPWPYGEVIDKEIGEVIAPGLNVKWKEPDDGFKGKTNKISEIHCEIKQFSKQTMKF